MHQEKADLGADDQARVAPFHPLQVGQSPVDNWIETRRDAVFPYLFTGTAQAVMGVSSAA